MSDDWQPGDLALCVNDRVIKCRQGHYHYGGYSPQVGQTKRVIRVISEHSNGFTTCRQTVLELEGGFSGLASRFRKIRPHTPDAEDEETIRLLTGKPVREPAA